MTVGVLHFCSPLPWRIKVLHLLLLLTLATVSAGPGALLTYWQKFVIMIKYLNDTNKKYFTLSTDDLKLIT